MQFLVQHVLPHCRAMRRRWRGIPHHRHHRPLRRLPRPTDSPLAPAPTQRVPHSPQSLHQLRTGECGLQNPVSRANTKTVTGGTRTVAYRIHARMWHTRVHRLCACSVRACTVCPALQIAEVCTASTTVHRAHKSRRTSTTRARYLQSGHGVRKQCAVSTTRAPSLDPPGSPVPSIATTVTPYRQPWSRLQAAPVTPGHSPCAPKTYPCGDARSGR